MKGIIILYGAICVLALALKYILKAVQTVAGKKREAGNHQQEHDRAHLIKFIILILLALIILFRG